MPRLPEIFERDKLPEDKRQIHDYLVKARGKVSDGYAPLLHCPEFVGRAAHLGTYIRFESSLAAKTRELLALTTAAELDDSYEQRSHTEGAAKAGVSQSTIDAINNKTDLTNAAEDETLPVCCARELVRTHTLSDSTFESAHKLLGDKGVVEIIGTIGYYAMLAYAHNAIQVRMRNG